ncbi:hypothetical protein TVAG_155070 [Trichomonas vaginalis G3]|uniref:Uncharacterized protein n=1 Tax=Trichomonas vaginalis (strain ATCC PRA-98 / G3) TaxID=412133 RepID=A2FY12_TRIV3|nr:hypothetical protein TVAGG3_1025590 [Trichomonas vaginalis G3]EAX90211.1 hypothetical protein TVAG_155070 [Trichomonas vaginalis G3]KAI5492474.1 hypothetical protein TVAGG3_1025590 [Trichomonas vaginalis G3]|eukprot:XP_001303141.1 hypothetical protein [Trichomonas vaginalis G3]
MSSRALMRLNSVIERLENTYACISSQEDEEFYSDNFDYSSESQSGLESPTMLGVTAERHEKSPEMLNLENDLNTILERIDELDGAFAASENPYKKEFAFLL